MLAVERQFGQITRIDSNTLTFIDFLRNPKGLTKVALSGAVGECSIRQLKSVCAGSVSKRDPALQLDPKLKASTT